MSSLSKAVQNTRRFVIVFIVFTVIVLVVQAITNELSKEKSGPTGGTIRYYLFPTQTSATFSRFTLDSLGLGNQTPSEFAIIGDFPEFPPVVNVYKIKEKQIRLSPLEKAEEIAEKFEMATNYIRVDDKNYIWQGGFNNYQFKFNTLEQTIDISSDILRASQTKAEDLTEDVYIQNTINLISSLGLSPQETIEVTGRVDYIAVDASGNQIATSKEQSFLVRVTLYKVLESASLLESYRNSNQPEVPPAVVSPIYRPELINGYVTVIWNNEAKEAKDVVNLQLNPSEFLLNSAATNKDFPFLMDVYPALELGQAFEGIKNKAPGTFLVSLKRESDNIFTEYQTLSVSKFNIDAPKTRIIYVEPYTWTHLNPTAPWDAHLYPFYWFEGKATLDNGEVADFIFLVDAIPTN